WDPVLWALRSGFGAADFARPARFPGYSATARSWMLAHATGAVRRGAACRAPVRPVAATGRSKQRPYPHLTQMPEPVLAGNRRREGAPHGAGAQMSHPTRAATDGAGRRRRLQADHAELDHLESGHELLLARPRGARRRHLVRERLHLLAGYHQRV